MKKNLIIKKSLLSLYSICTVLSVTSCGGEEIILDEPTPLAAGFEEIDDALTPTAGSVMEAIMAENSDYVSGILTGKNRTDLETTSEDEETIAETEAPSLSPEMLAVLEGNMSRLIACYEKADATYHREGQAKSEEIETVLEQSKRVIDDVGSVDLSILPKERADDLNAALLSVISCLQSVQEIMEQ